jgi:hypothetical protein
MTDLQVITLYNFIDKSCPLSTLTQVKAKRYAVDVCLLKTTERRKEICIQKNNG